MHPLNVRARWAALALAGPLILSTVACGTDDATNTASVPTATSSPVPAGSASGADALDQAFCDAHLALAIALSAPPSDEVDVGALAADLQATAPEELTETVATFLEVGERASEGEDDSLFVSDEFRDPAFVMDEAVAGSCGHAVIDVDAVDYGFDGMPAAVDPGPTMFKFTNAGSDLHEGILYRRKDGVVLDPVDVVNADPSGESGDLEEVGVAFIGSAGDQSYLTTDLEPGSYVLVCYFPKGVKTFDELTAADKDPEMDHRSAGMIVGFEVA